MTLFIILRAQIVRVVLGSGHFNWDDTRLTAAALAIFVCSLIPQSLMSLFVRAYYSRGNTKKPLLMNVFSAFCIIGCSYLAVHLFATVPEFRLFIQNILRVQDVSGGEIMMLPLGFAVGTTINMLLHWVAFEREFKGFTRAISRSALEVVFGSIVMGFVAYYFLNLLSFVFDLDSFIGIFLQGFIAGMIGIFVFVVLLMLLKNKELKIISKTLHHKIWKTKVVPADPSGA
jgi:peptidoglycan biosynthesis protein MviN/MurJ (putative lipid II flippase)